MTKALAVAIPDSVKPRPSARQIIEATALAIQAERLEHLRLAKEAHKNAKTRYEAAALKILRRGFRERVPTSIYISGHYAEGKHFQNGEVQFKFDLIARDHPELEAFTQELNRCQDALQETGATDLDMIRRELQQARQGQDTTVQALLAVPEIRTALLAAGKKLLDTPTPADKAGAIEA